MQKVLCVGLWWPTIFQDAKHYYKECDICQWIKNSSYHDEMPLYPFITLEPIYKWEVDFVRPINPIVRCVGACYIITAID